MSLQALTEVRKRHVFYLSGFDPRGASFYHRLYQDESAKQAPLIKTNIKVGARSRKEKHISHWQIDANCFNQQQVTTDYFFLNWDDIVRKSWESNLLKLTVSSIQIYYRYYLCGAFAKIKKYHQGPFYSALYPWLYLLALIFFSTVIGLSAFTVLNSFISLPFLPAAVSLPLALISLFYGTRLANQWGVFWLLRIYIFVIQQGFNNSSEILLRASQFVESIKRTQENNPADEILLVGHSVGSILAIHIAAIYVQQHPQLAANIKLVTLGQCIPLLSGMPQAKQFNQHLTFIENQNVMTWTDYVARADSLAFIREDKLLKPMSPQPNTQIVRFFNMFTAKRYKEITRNKLKLHFQYMMATEILGDYDYFTMTAGTSPIKSKEVNRAI